MDKKSAEEIYDMFLACLFGCYENTNMQNESEKFQQRYDVLKEQHGVVDGGKIAFVERLMEKF